MGVSNLRSRVGELYQRTLSKPPIGEKGLHFRSGIGDILLVREHNPSTDTDSFYLGLHCGEGRVLPWNPEQGRCTYLGTQRRTKCSFVVVGKLNDEVRINHHIGTHNCSLLRQGRGKVGDLSHMKRNGYRVNTPSGIHDIPFGKNTTSIGHYYISMSDPETLSYVIERLLDFYPEAPF